MSEANKHEPRCPILPLDASHLLLHGRNQLEASFSLHPQRFWYNRAASSLRADIFALP